MGNLNIRFAFERLPSWLKGFTLIIILFALVSLLIILGSGNGYSLLPDWEPAKVTHQVVYNNSLETLWVRPNIYIGDSAADLNLAASGGRVFIFGTVDIEEARSVIALEASTGNLVWNSDPKPSLTMFSDRGGLYVGESGGGGRITKYDLTTGDILWSRFFWYASGVLHLIVYKDQLHAYMAPDKHRILRTSDGKTILAILPKQPPFFDSIICGEIYQTPIYTSDTVYYRTGKNSEVGKVCAVDISTGKLRWKSDLNAISNIVVMENAVFVLVENGDLLALNPATGEEISTLKISFDNIPFDFHTPRAEVVPYFVAYDDENDILFVYLGDSRQLFSFLVSEKRVGCVF
jgi:outer membrane protein assembly factor BamB